MNIRHELIKVSKELKADENKYLIKHETYELDFDNYRSYIEDKFLHVLKGYGSKIGTIESVLLSIKNKTNGYVNCFVEFEKEEGVFIPDLVLAFSIGESIKSLTNNSKVIVELSFNDLKIEESFSIVDFFNKFTIDAIHTMIDKFVDRIKKKYGIYEDGGNYQYYKFHSEGDLHRNVLLNTLENDYGINFRNYDLSPTGIKPKNKKTDDILKNLFKQGD